MTWQLALDFVRAVVWPAVVVTLAMLFRSQLRGAVGRLSSVETPVATVSFDAAADQALSVVQEDEQVSTQLQPGSLGGTWPDFEEHRRSVRNLGSGDPLRAYNYGQNVIQHIRRALAAHAGTEPQRTELLNLKNQLSSEALALAEGGGSVPQRDLLPFIDRVEDACYEAVIVLSATKRAQLEAGPQAELEPPTAAQGDAERPATYQAG